MTRVADRLRLMAMLEEAVVAGVRQSEACQYVGISERTLQRWQQSPDDRRPTAASRPVPKNKLSAEEEQQVLHADNGAPMKSQVLQVKLAELKITPSYSRPRVSNDNAHVESLFRTLKYVPSWPEKGFASLENARGWVETFVVWYNEEHRHSGIRDVTPGQRHRGEDVPCWRSVNQCMRQQSS